MNRTKKLARGLQLFAAEPNTITTQQITVCLLYTSDAADD